MYFYPKHISQEVIDALASIELTFNGDELEIPDDSITGSDNGFTAKGVKLVRRLMTFNGYQDAPKTFSTLEGDMVPSGVDRYQCEICGYWMDRKMSPSDERQHDTQCRPQYEWILA